MLAPGNVRRLIAWVLACTCAPLAPEGVAQTAQEHEVKAAFLSKFPAFVEWPDAASSGTFLIQVAGAPEVAAELRQMGLRAPGGRPVAVRELGVAQAPAPGGMVFVGRGAEGRLPHIARALAGTPTLIVSELPGALEQGAMINFMLREDRVRFEVALDSAEARGLRMNARLLALAVGVRKGRP